MAVYTSLSRIERSREVALDTNVTIAEDGVLMVKVPGGGFKASTGGAGEIVAGFAFVRTTAAPFTPTTWVRSETFDVGVSNVVTLSRAPVASSTFIWNNSTGAAITPDSVTGTTVTMTTADPEGNSITVTYRYTLTVAEAQSKVGDQLPGQYAGNKLGSVGLAQTGLIFTNAFDSAQNYRSVGPLKAGANGLVTIGGSGTTLNAYVVSLPTEETPFLGIQFNFA